jgi:hypothetical protein
MSVLCIDLEDLQTGTYAERYNQLPEVEVNDETRRTNPHAELFIKDITEAIIKYDLQDYIGLRLIHKHFKIESNQIMVEGYEEIEGTPSFVTSAQNIKDAAAMKFIPASSIFTEEGPVVFETSTDKEVYDGVALLLKHPEFIEEFKCLINSYKLNNIFALAVLKRKPLSQDMQSNDLYLEKNFNKPKGRSVVQLSQDENINKNSIKTSWQFRDGLKELRCLVCAWGICRHFMN